MIPGLLEKRNRVLEGVAKVPRDVLVVILLVLIALASFGLGYEAGQGAAAQTVQVGFAPDISTSTDGMVVASRSGSKYYLPWCGGASRISVANKVWFESEAEAQAQGYTPASNCDGI